MTSWPNLLDMYRSEREEGQSTTPVGRWLRWHAVASRLAVQIANRVVAAAPVDDELVDAYVAVRDRMIRLDRDHRKGEGG